MHSWCSPFLLTTDNFGATTNVWRLDQGDPQPTLLHPSLPPTRHAATTTTVHIVSPNERFLAIALSSHTSASWRIYDLSTGSLISESDFPQTQSHSLGRWQNAGDLAALTVEQGGKQVILRYKLTDEGQLEQRGCAIATPEDPARTDSFELQHLAKDGSIFTYASDIPSKHPLGIAYYPPYSDRTTFPARLALPFTSEEKDTIVAKNFIQVSENSLAFSVEENEWGADMNPIAALSTVRLVTYTTCTTPNDKPHMTLSWTIRLEHAVEEIAYVPTLGTGTIVVQGRWHAPYAGDGSRGPDKRVLTFLDPSTGALLKQTEQTVVPKGASLQCIGPNWVVYNKLAQTPWLYVIPLTRVMEIGLDGVENSGGQMDAQVKKVEVRNGPEPWNSKAKKAAEQGRWRWVNDAELLPDGKLVVFPERGPEFWVLDPTMID